MRSPVKMKISALRSSLKAKDNPKEEITKILKTESANIFLACIMMVFGGNYIHIFPRGNIITYT